MRFLGSADAQRANADNASGMLARLQQDSFW